MTIHQATTSSMPTVPMTSQRKIAGLTQPEPQGCPFLALIRPSDEGERQAQAMENWFQACASDEPFALELVGTRRDQGFVLRASSEAQLALLCKQLEAQYPQAEIVRILPQFDPLIVHAGEHAVIGEFSLTQPSYLPIKTFSGKVLAEPGSDPLAGLLASMESVGSGQKMVAQLALVRAPETWLSADIRKSVEHALQPERDKMALSTKNMSTRSDTDEAVKLFALIVAGACGLFAYKWYLAQDWFYLQLLCIGLVLASLVFFWWKLFRQSSPPIYDTKLVAEKMARAGFYTQLRVIVIGQKQTSTIDDLVAHIQALEVAYRQFTLASANSLYLKRNRFLPGRKRFYQRIGKTIFVWLARCLPDSLKTAWQSFLNEKLLQNRFVRKILHKDVSPVQWLTSARLAFPYAPILLRLLHGGAYSWQILNSLELSGMYHLPQETADLPLVRRISIKGLLASPEIAHEIERMPSPLPPALIGYSKHRRFSVPVYLPFDALFSHKFFAGMSRSGKSVLIQLLTLAAMQPLQEPTTTIQPGVFVADPHRDLIMDILKLVPPSRADDVLLLDMTDTEHPIALNPLDASMGFTRDQAVSNLMSSFQRIWSEQWGPRMAYFLNSVCLLLYTLNERLVAAGEPEKQYTLLDINPILQYKDYAVQVLSALDMTETWHQELMVFWQNTYLNLNPSFKNEIIMPIVSKIGVFSDNAQLRRIVGQPITCAPVHQAVTEGKIVLCALSARDMDDSAVNILGSALINLLHRSFGLQQAIPLKQRRKVFVAVDEFQNFSGSDFDKLLSEDAKYGCAMLLATQNLKRLNKIRDGLLEMVLSNCQQLCVFRVSAADARIMEEELQEKVTIKNIISLPALNCYARLAIPGNPLQIVSVVLAQPASWDDDPERDRIVEYIRRINQDRARPISEVDQLYADHLQQFLDVKGMVGRFQREARKVRNKKEEQDEEEELVQDLQTNQVVVGTKQNTQGGSTLGETVQTDGETEGLRDKANPTRNHRRSRHTGKKRVGVPPPEPTDDAGKDSPLPGKGGTVAASGTSWGGGMGYEGREGCERG